MYVQFEHDNVYRNTIGCLKYSTESSSANTFSTEDEKQDYHHE